MPDQDKNQKKQEELEEKEQVQPEEKEKKSDSQSEDESGDESVAENEKTDEKQEETDKQDEETQEKKDAGEEESEDEKKEDAENDEEETPEVPDVQEVEVEDPNLIRVSEEDNPKAHWYVVHTYSGRENRVAETLKQRAQTLSLTDKIIKILIPTKEKIQIKKGQRKKIKEKIFPGYMLVNMIMSDDAWLAVRTTNGVTGFVGTSSKPSPIPTHEVEAIRNYTQQATPQYKAEYVEGQAVKITDGPFTDFLGTVQSINEERGEVEVLINIFGRETPVELDFLQVEKV